VRAGRKRNARNAESQGHRKDSPPEARPGDPDDAGAVIVPPGYGAIKRKASPGRFRQGRGVAEDPGVHRDTECSTASRAKMLWVRDQNQRFRVRAHNLLPKDYVRYRLTGAESCRRGL